MTFEDVVKIESLRRRIEQLQGQLNNQAKAVVFAVADDVGQTRKWCEITADVAPLMRETLCKATVAQIVHLLDDSQKLGVDVAEPKKALYDFLEGLKVQET